MKDRNENILVATDKLVAFKKKVAIWKKRMREDDLDIFPLVQKLVFPIIGEHLTRLENKIKQYFPSISIEEFDWICNPFLDLSVINHYNFKLCREEELARISSNRTLKLNYVQLPMDAFWISVIKEYPTLSKKAIKYYCNSQLCTYVNRDFPIFLNNNKTKKRERF